jgi:hypothetical protein
VIREIKVILYRLLDSACRLDCPLCAVYGGGSGIALADGGGTLEKGCDFAKSVAELLLGGHGIV